MKVWEYIWMEIVETEDEVIDKREVINRAGGERIIKDSIKHHFGLRLCISGLYNKVPEEVRKWWIHTPTPCMVKKERYTCDKCWENFMDKRIGGFVPVVIKGGKMRK